MQLIKNNLEAYYERWQAAPEGKGISVLKEEEMRHRFAESDAYPYDFSEEAMKGKLFVMAMGFADGRFIRKLREALPKAAFLFVWEPDVDSFLYACSQEDVSDLLRRKDISVVVGGYDTNRVRIERELVKNLGFQNMYHAFVLPVPGFFDMYNSEAKKLVGIYKKAIFEASTDAATRERFGRINSRCELLALSQLNDNSSVDQFLDRIPTREIPVILIAAGPSLKKNVGELKDIGGKAILIAVSHASKTVYENGVKVHLTAMADSQEGFGFLDFDRDASLRLILNTRCAGETQRKYNGGIIYESLDPELFPVSRFRRETYDYPNGGSVATNIAGLFLTAGFKRVILVGQDLAYDENGFSHAGGEKEEMGSVKETEGIDGKKVKTRGDWLFFKKGYETLIELHPEAEVIDATEGGALIRGSKVMSLRDAIDTYCGQEYPVEEWIDCRDKAPEGEAEEIARIIRMHYEKCCQMHEKLAEAVNLNRNILGYLTAGQLGDADKAGECNRYDSLYKEILTESDAALLMKYCDDLLQLYVKEALSLEADADLALKLDFEDSLFEKMLARDEELMGYLEELFPKIVKGC